MIDPAVVAARARREALAQVRAELAAELRGAPYNAPARAQITYVGGLARARRLVEDRYQAALSAEEQIVMDGISTDLFVAAVKAGWEAIPDGNMDDMTPDVLAAALMAAVDVLFTEAAW
jgi:hypothetical protein